MLSAGQRALSDLFAGRDDDKFDRIRWETWDSGRPVLPGALAVLECRLKNVFEGGDHVILVGEVERLAEEDGEPLLYFQGNYAGLDPGPQG